MTNKEYAANLLVEAAEILQGQDILQEGSFNNFIKKVLYNEERNEVGDTIKKMNYPITIYDIAFADLKENEIENLVKRSTRCIIGESSKSDAINRFIRVFSTTKNGKTIMTNSLANKKVTLYKINANGAYYNKNKGIYDISNYGFSTEIVLSTNIKALTDASSKDVIYVSPDTKIKGILKSIKPIFSNLKYTHYHIDQDELEEFVNYSEDTIDIATTGCEKYELVSLANKEGKSDSEMLSVFEHEALKVVKEINSKLPSGYKAGDDWCKSSGYIYIERV